MTTILFILSCPVRMPNGAFGVMTGTATNAHFRQFSTLWRARFRHALLLITLRAAVDAPLDLVLIDGESDYKRLKVRFDREYERRRLPLPAGPR
jgi:hypothetical protein